MARVPSSLRSPTGALTRRQLLTGIGGCDAAREKLNRCVGLSPLVNSVVDVSVSGTQPSGFISSAVVVDDIEETDDRNAPKGATAKAPRLEMTYRNMILDMKVIAVL